MVLDIQVLYMHPSHMISSAATVPYPLNGSIQLPCLERADYFQSKL